MSYCTITHVQGLNPQRGAYGATTKPTSTEVNEFISQISNEIDSILLARGLTVPVTTPIEFVGALELGNAQGAAALAEMAMLPDPGTMGGTSHGHQLWAMYEKFKAWLQKGDLPTSLSGGHLGPQSFHEQTSDTETEPGDTYDWHKPKVRKNMEF